MQKAALFWCHGLHVHWESNIWEIPGAEGKEVFLTQEKRERRATTQSDINKEKERSWVFPELAESNPQEKMNI